MSELDESLRELRDDLHTVLTPPDLARVVDRARQRSVRRRMQIGAIAAVVAVSVAVPALRTMPEPPPAGPPPPPTEYEVDFADAEHGFALGRDCPDPAELCTFTLLATADGGRSWQERPLPEGGEAYESDVLSVLGPDRLTVLLAHPGGEYVGEYVSADAGRTWREYGVLRAEAPRRIPGRARLTYTCTGSTCERRFGVAAPDEGTWSPTVAQPPLVAGDPGAEATAGGRYWAIGREPASGGWAVSVTSDGGVTWATYPLDVPGQPTRRDPWSVVEHDGTLYLTMVGADGSRPVELLAVFRSTDGGRSWTRTFRASGLVNVYGEAVATSDGRLVVYSTTEGTLESRDGRTFTKAERQLAGPVTWTRGGYLAKGEDAYEISRDGVHWRRFELP